MSDQTVLWDKDEQDAFVTLTLNRPDKMNAMNQELGDALEAAIKRAVKDPDVRAIIITGAGRAFTTGFDLVRVPAAEIARTAAVEMRRMLTGDVQAREGILIPLKLQCRESTGPARRSTIDGFER